MILRNAANSQPYSIINLLILLFPLTFQPSAIFNHIRRIPSSKPWTSNNDVLNVAPRQFFTETKKKITAFTKGACILALIFLYIFHCCSVSNSIILIILSWKNPVKDRIHFIIKASGADVSRRALVRLSRIKNKGYLFKRTYIYSRLRLRPSLLSRVTCLAKLPWASPPSRVTLLWC